MRFTETYGIHFSILCSQSPSQPFPSETTRTHLTNSDRSSSVCSRCYIQRTADTGMSGHLTRDEAFELIRILGFFDFSFTFESLGPSTLGFVFFGCFKGVCRGEGSVRWFLFFARGRDRCFGIG